MKSVLVTTSWDDGHVLDVRLAALLKKYGIQGTFYIAPRDHESKESDRLTNEQVKTIGDSFEIGAHTMTHPDLPKIPDDDAWSEMKDSKEYLEKILNREVKAFCYPRGKYRSRHVAMARKAGFLYARTTKRLSTVIDRNPFEARTTVNTYNHYSDLWKIARFAKFNPRKIVEYFQWDALAKAMFDRILETGGVFHLWGHSWEVDGHGDWEKLEGVLAHIAHKQNVHYVVNSELVAPRKKLLVASPYFPPHIGGSEFYALNISTLLQRNYGWKVAIMTTGERGFFSKQLEVSDNLRIYRLPYWFKISNTPINPLWPFIVKRIIAEENPDIINAHAPVPGLADVAIRAAKHIPSVLTYHMAGMQKGNAFQHFLIAIYENFVLPRTLKKASRVIAASDAVSKYIMANFGIKTSVIMPGVDPNFFVPSSERGSNTILYVGSTSKHDLHKGLKYLLEALAQILKISSNREIKLVVVGGGTNSDYFIDLANKLNIQASVIFTGPQVGKQLLNQYHRASLLVLPSLNESFGMVILEAMACGLPVVATNVGSIPKLVENGETGFIVPPQDPGALAEKILLLLSDQRQSEAFAKAGRTKAGRNFSWSDRAMLYDHLLTEITKSKELSPGTHSALIPTETFISENWSEHDKKLTQKAKLLTIAILTYNSEKTIASCLDSLIAQTNRNFRVLILDDDSVDSTLNIVRNYQSDGSLEIDIVRNGSHHIAKGRNIALKTCKTSFLAFLDSDDYASSDWIEIILTSFEIHSHAVLIYGPTQSWANSLSGKAIVNNDAMIRRLFAKGEFQFCTANSAFNMNVMGDETFDEDFPYAEDLEIASRLKRRHELVFVPEMHVNQRSRESLTSYATQMYRYGTWKMYYSFVSQDYRYIDFVPLIIGLGSFLVALFTQSWLPLLALPVLSLVEALFISLIVREGFLVSLLSFPAWIIKNLAWSAGVAIGIYTFAMNWKFRQRFESKRNQTATIVHVAAYYPPSLGGLERVAKETSEQLARDGSMVTVLTSDIGANSAAKVERQPNLTVKRLWAFEIAHTPIAPTLIWHLIRLPARSVIHLHLAQAYWPEAVFIVSKLRRIPFVVHYHLDVGPSGPLGFILPLYKKYILRLVLKAATRVIVFSSAQAALLHEKYGINRNRIVIIPNGVGDEFMWNHPRTNPHTPMRLLYVGRLSVQKRIERLIKAMGLMRIDAHLTIVGEGEDREKLEALSKELKINDKISFVGKKYGAELLEQYRGADVFLIASDIEGMPLVVLEAMASGLPVVGSDVPGIHELVKDVGFLVNEPYEKEFADVLTGLATTPREFQMLSKQSLGKGREYSWMRLAGKLKEMYNEIGS
jgi:glycosyltransferase involved in cell wall biosynthesis/peptidoglycan/xylan/chitin deacetylase (PgdA/CDA1 family)